MGDIADMMIDGTLDYETGEYIDGNSPGYPRRMSDIGRRYSSKAKQSPAYSTVLNFLSQMGVVSRQAIIREYTNNSRQGINSVCNKIRGTKESWTAFKEWFYKTHPEYSPKPIINTKLD